MEYKDLLHYIQHVGTDPSRLIFEDELTSIYNRRFLMNYFQYKVPWNSLDSRPVSLLLMDLDHFKQINDDYGHGVGDQVLIWVATLLNELSEKMGIAIRYGGDEFMIFMPHADKGSALQVGEQIIQRIHLESVHLPDFDAELSITLSMGVSSAPDDAHTGKALIQQADTALYYAKKTGRNRLADAGQVVAEEVFVKTALHQLDKAVISGRKAQLTKVAGALKKFVKRQSQFLIIEGGGGMGKSEFLQALRRNLAKSKIPQVLVKAIPQEGFRPFYITTNILIELLNQQPDKGTEILNELTFQEINYLSHILPQLGDPAELPEQEDEKTLREQIFATVIYFFAKLLKSKPLILFIDDLHLCDTATLLLLRRLLLRGEIPFFICATAPLIDADKAQAKPLPLERILSAYEQELSIDKIALTPLSAIAIAHNFKEMFPQVTLPENFQDNLFQLTQGNPLFICEIQRKLILDGKITLTGQGWVIEPLEAEYLPRSLEEIVRQKLKALDEESRQLLDQASTFGEDVSLSVLTGSSENREIQVLEFIDIAVPQGLITSDYQMNDETIRFMSKQVSDITYDAIQEDRKKELHERIGNYQEVLYEQRLLPSAATLAYHYQLSANQEKARLYQDFQKIHNQKIFNEEEAANYTGEKPETTVPEDVPLDAAGLSIVPKAVRALLTAVHNVKLYPPGSKAIVVATHQLKETIDKILATNERLNITIAEDALKVNGEPADVSEFKAISEEFMKLLNRLELKGIAISQGFAERELTGMLEGMGSISKKMIDRRFWQGFSADQRLLHIELKQVRYTTMKETDEALQDQEKTLENSRSAAQRVSAKLLAVDRDIDEQELELIPQVLRNLTTAASNIKLYPPESKANIQSFERLYQVLKSFLTTHPALTLAQVGDALLINGQKIDTEGFKGIADGNLRFMQSIKLRSLGFLRDISARELRVFIETIGRHSTDDFDSKFWRRFAIKQHLSGIMFDQRLYQTWEEITGPGTGQQEAMVEPAEGTSSAAESFSSQDVAEKEAMSEADQVDEDGVFGGDIETIEEQLMDVCLKGDEDRFQGLLGQLFEDFTNQPPQNKMEKIKACDRLQANPMFGSQLRWVDLLVDALLIAFAEEQQHEILKEMAGLLSRTAADLIQFGDYQRASRIFTHLKKRQRQLQESIHTQVQRDKLAFIEKLEPKTEKLLAEDLKSRNPSRMRQVAQLLGSLGPAMIPLLTEVIKHEDNLRVRQIASQVLKATGSEGGELLRRELALEGLPAIRVRILEVIDGITDDFQTELAYCLEDKNSEIRQAAFRLAGRLDDEQAISLLLNYTNHDDESLAVAAITSLGKFKHSTTVEALVSLLNTTKETERKTACCRALGQIADPAAIEPLAKIMTPKGFFLLRKKKDSMARSSAAFALAHITDSRAAEVLAGYTEDRDPVVRRIAQAKLNKSALPSPANRK